MSQDISCVSHGSSAICIGIEVIHVAVGGKAPEVDPLDVDFIRSAVMLINDKENEDFRVDCSLAGLLHQVARVSVNLIPFMCNTNSGRYVMCVEPEILVRFRYSGMDNKCEEKVKQVLDSFFEISDPRDGTFRYEIHQVSNIISPWMIDLKETMRIRARENLSYPHRILDMYASGYKDSNV